MMKRRVVAYSIASIVFLGAIIMIRMRSQASTDKSAEGARPVTVSVVAAQYGTITGRIWATGALEGIHEAEIISETSGRIVRIDAEVDSRLPANGRIGQVENELQEISLDRARAQTAAAVANSQKAAADLKRIKSLFDQNAVSESQLENAELAAKSALAQLRGAQAAEKLAQKQFDDTILRTPIEGRLAQKFITVGKMITPGVKVATVVDDSRMKLVAGIPEESVSSVRTGDKVEVTSDAVPGEAYNGVVKSVALKADPMTRTFQVEIEFPNDRARSMKSGMFARAVITTYVSDSLLLIPSVALIESGTSGYGVFVVKGARAVRREITIGARNDSLVAVMSGLVPGDTVVTFGQLNLRNGTIVRYGTSD